MIQSGDMFWQCPAHGQAFKFRAKTGPGKVQSVSLERKRRGSLDMIDLRPQIGHKLAQGVKRALDQIAFARLVIFRVQVGPIAVIRVCAGHHVTAVGARPGLGIIKRICPAGDIPA